MEVKLREAEPRDIAPMLSMLRMLHIETSYMGGMVKLGPKTHNWLLGLIDRAVYRKEGIALVAIDTHCTDAAQYAGGLLAVDVEFPYDHDAGKCLVGYGTIVAPDYRAKGIASALYKKAFELAVERGYDSYFGAYLPGNERIQKLLPKLGFNDFEMAVVKRLKES